MNINGSRGANLQTCPSCSRKVAWKDMRWREQYGRKAGSSRKGLDAFPSTDSDLDIFGRGLWLIFSANEGRKGERMQRLEMENSGKMKMPLAAYNASGATAK